MHTQLVSSTSAVRGGAGASAPIISHQDKATTNKTQEIWLVQKTALFRSTDAVLIVQFQFLQIHEVASAGRTCRAFLHISKAALIWKGWHARLALPAPLPNVPTNHQALVKAYYSENCRKAVVCLNAAIRPAQPFAENLGYRQIREIVSERRNDLAKNLYRFAEENLLDLVRIVLQSPSMNDTHRGIAVCGAARNGHLTIVQELLKGNAVIYQKGASVIAAAENGHLAIVQELLKNNAIISEGHRGNAVRNATENGHLVIVQELLKNNTFISEDLRSLAVIAAADNGHLAILQFLLENGTISEESRTEAIQVAQTKSYDAIVKLLTP